MNNLNEKADSKSQQRLMGMVYAYKTGKLKLDKLPTSLADKIKSIADGERRKTGDKRKFTKGISINDAKDFASTKHKDLPENIQKESKILRFDDYVKENIDNPLDGGLSDGLTIEDIAKMHDIPLEYLEEILPKAIDIEMEHTEDEEVAARIALDHLYETPVYYDDKIGLPEMEERLEDLSDDEIEKIVKFDEYEKNDK